MGEFEYISIMAEAKTRANEDDVGAFLETVENENKRKDAYTILDLMKKVTGEKPVMWGESIVGFGSYTYTYASGRTGDWPTVGFSPRKQSLSIYIMSGFDGYEALLAKLGKHKTGKACLYINKLSDVNMEILEELIRRSANFSGGVRSGARRSEVGNR